MSATATRQYVGYEVALPLAGLLVTITAVAGAWIMGSLNWIMLCGGLAGGVALSGST